MTELLTPRWYPLDYHRQQSQLFHSDARFCATWAGRRSGKTEIVKRRIIKKAIDYDTTDDGWFVLTAPTHSQAKRIFWRDAKKFVPDWMRAGKPSESELTIRLVTGTEITIMGMDQPDRIEGRPLDGWGGDEFASMKANLWGEKVLPALATKGRPPGFAMLSGVPEGRNHFYDIAMDWQALHKEESALHHTGCWPSADILDDSIIEQARRELDELTFQQEYYGSFINFAGRAYRDFTRETHCQDLRYDPTKPLIFCLDFNISPGVAVVCQELQVGNPLDGVPADESVTCIIGEVHIPRNSTTVAVCKRLGQDWASHKHEIHVYGDATGGAGGTTAVMGSDVDLIEQVLRPKFQGQLSMRFKRSNPTERSRINAVNSRIKAMDGTIRLLVDETKAPAVVKDLEGVVLLKGGSGELDKSNDLLTHWTDGLGYYIEEKFPIQGRGFTRREMF